MVLVELKPSKRLALSGISFASFSNSIPARPLQCLSQRSEIGSGIMARVLIVEDDWAESLILANIVEQAGHEISFASGGEEALNVYLRGGIDVVVTDLHMLDGDGLELIDALRSLLPEPVIIAVSGLGPELLATARIKGVFAALSKPVDPHELVEALEKATPHGSAPPARIDVG